MSDITTVRACEVFDRRNSAVFIALTAINGIAILAAAAAWISSQGWKQAPVVFAGLTILLAISVAIQQARWFLLPLMKKPAPVKVKRRWKVAVVTTFVPGAEPLEMLEATIKSLVDLDYPHDTWVLDEGNDDCVKALCNRYSVHHFSRKDRAEYQSDSGAFRAGTKYGNYNAWLSEIGYANYEVLTAFDPDHIPVPTFLSSALSYFEDARIGYVQVAQVYGNQAESWIARGAAEETYDYYSTIQMASYGARFPIIVGGHNTHRVDALQKIGGLAAHDADDILTTLLYRDAGWQGVYVPRILARGRTPADWHSYLTQQRRWARSVIDIKLRTYPSLSKNAPLATRFLSLIHGLNYVVQGVLPALVLGLLCLICATAKSSQGTVASFVVPTFILVACYGLSECFRQCFYLDPRGERGFHWRASVLRWARWPQMLLALQDVILDRRPNYKITAKVKGMTFRLRLLLPHLFALAVVAVSWCVGVWTGQATGLSHAIFLSGIVATCALSATFIASALASEKAAAGPRLEEKNRIQAGGQLSLDHSDPLPVWSDAAPSKTFGAADHSTASERSSASDSTAIACSRRQSVVLFVALWVVVIGYQAIVGGYNVDFYYEDTAPHFVTGAMVADYVRTSLGTDPVAFAEQYYLRSPKVAFGRWPPLFHLVQGAVYGMFGVSKVTALALLAAITATTCVVLFARAQRLFGGLVASLTLLLFLGSATVRWHSLLVMSDLLTTLFCMLSGFALADFLMGRRSRDLVMASIWTAIAMMTKETAVHLLFLAPVLFVVADGMACLRDRRIQILAGGLLALGAATLSFRLSSGFGLHGYRDFGQLLSRMTQWNDARRIIAAFLEISPPFILFLASCGFIVKFGRRLPNDTRVHLQLSVCWISVVIGFFLMSPALPDGRYFMPALIPLMMLIAHLFHAIRESLAERFRSGAWIVPATLAVTAVLTSPQSNEGAIRGYASVARAIPVRPNVTMLISSNPFGEGAFITERLLFDREQQGIVLRGSKVLSTSDWHGTDYQLSKQDSDEILDFLRSFPVHYIIVDEHRFTNEPPPPDRELLRRALREHPQEFRETGRFPLSRGSDRFDQAFTIYENLGAKESASSTFEVPLNYSLNRALRLKPTPR